METQQKVEQLTAEINKVKLQKVRILLLSGCLALCSPPRHSAAQHVFADRSLLQRETPYWKSIWRCKSCRQVVICAAFDQCSSTSYGMSKSTDVFWSLEQAREGRDSVVEAATAAWWLMGPSTTSFVKEALQIDGVMSFAPRVGQRPIHMTCEEVAAMPDADFNRLWQVVMTAHM